MIDSNAQIAIVTIVSFFGALVGTAISNLISARLAGEERKEARRRENLKGLSDAMKALTETYAGFLDNTSNQAFVYLKRVTQAQAIMLSLDDDRLREIAIDQLHTEYPQAQNGIAPDIYEPNRKACREAIIRLAEMIRHASK